MSMTIKKKVAPPISAPTKPLVKSLIKPVAKPAPAVVMPEVHAASAPHEKIGPNSSVTSGTVVPTSHLSAHVTSDDVVAAAQEELVGVVASGSISVQYKDGSSTEEKEVVQEKLMPSTHATVGVTIGVTRNLGNFESVKMQVALFLPCLVDAQDIEDTYAQGKEWVDGKINGLNAEIDEQLGK